MARDVVPESRARLITELGGVVTGDRKASEIGVVVVGAHCSDTTTQVRMHDAEESAGSFEVVPKIGECALGSIQSVVSP